MTVTAKICGLSTHDTVAAAVRRGASHVGFVFYPPSPRNVGFDQAAGLGARVPGHIGKVGVFVDPDDALVGAALAVAVGRASSVGARVTVGVATPVGEASATAGRGVTLG